MKKFDNKEIESRAELFISESAEKKSNDKLINLGAEILKSESNKFLKKRGITTAFKIIRNDITINRMREAAVNIGILKQFNRYKINKEIFEQATKYINENSNSNLKYFSHLDYMQCYYNFTINHTLGFEYNIGSRELAGILLLYRKFHTDSQEQTINIPKLTKEILTKEYKKCLRGWDSEKQDYLDFSVFQISNNLIDKSLDQYFYLYKEDYPICYNGFLLYQLFSRHPYPDELNQKNIDLIVKDLITSAVSKDHLTIITNFLPRRN